MISILQIHTQEQMNIRQESVTRIDQEQSSHNPGPDPRARSELDSSAAIVTREFAKDRERKRGKTKFLAAKKKERKEEKFENKKEK